MQWHQQPLRTEARGEAGRIQVRPHRHGEWTEGRERDRTGQIRTG